MNSFPDEISFVPVQLRADAGICLLIPVICFPRSENEPIPFPRDDLSGAALTATMKQTRVLFKKAIHPLCRLSLLFALSLLSSHSPISIHARCHHAHCHRSPRKGTKEEKKRGKAGKALGKNVAEERR